MFLSAAPPDRVAVIDAATGTKRTYAELEGDVNLRRDAWFEDGHRKLVFGFVGNDYESVVGYLAALEADQPVLLLERTIDPSMASRLVDHYRPALLFGSPEGAAFSDYVRVGDGPTDARMRTTGATSSLHSDLALLLSTSGTTGSPKLVRLSSRAVRDNARAIASALCITSDDRAITSLPFSYTYGLSVLHSHLCAGASIVLTKHGLVSTGFWDAVRNHGVTSLAGVPFSYQVLSRFNLDKMAGPTLTTLTQAGGRLDPTVVAKFDREIRARGGRFFVMYGQTEATARIAVVPPEHCARKLGSAGLPVPGGTLSIETAEGLTRLPNVSGEVVYQGPNVMMGYAERAEDLALPDQLGGVLRTGDLGYLDEDGYVYLTGRLKRIAKVHGIRVSLDEVEAWLAPMGRAAALATGDKIMIVHELGEALRFATARELLGKSLRLHPSSFVFRAVEQLPVSENGKLNYQALAELGADRPVAPGGGADRP